MRITSVTARAALVAWLLCAMPLAAVEWTTFEGPARGFPALRDLAGKKLADGDFTQWVDNAGLHVRIAYVGQSRRIEEQAGMVPSRDARREGLSPVRGELQIRNRDGEEARGH